MILTILSSTGSSHEYVWISVHLVCISWLLLLFSCPVISDCFVTPWTAAHQASLSLTISWSLPKFMSIASVMPSGQLILGHPLLLPSPVFPSIRDFSSKSVVPIKWPKYWSFSFCIMIILGLFIGFVEKYQRGEAPFSTHHIRSTS